MRTRNHPLVRAVVLVLVVAAAGAAVYRQWARADGAATRRALSNAHATGAAAAMGEPAAEAPLGEDLASTTKFANNVDILAPVAPRLDATGAPPSRGADPEWYGARALDNESKSAILFSSSKAGDLVFPIESGPPSPPMDLRPMPNVKPESHPATRPSH